MQLFIAYHFRGGVTPAGGTDGPTDAAGLSPTDQLCKRPGTGGLTPRDISRIMIHGSEDLSGDVAGQGRLNLQALGKGCDFLLS